MEDKEIRVMLDRLKKISPKDFEEADLLAGEVWESIKTKMPKENAIQLVNFLFLLGCTINKYSCELFDAIIKDCEDLIKASS